MAEGAPPPGVAGWVDLDPLLAYSADWPQVNVPGAGTPVRLRRLHHEPTTRASLSLVHFPPGWVRDAVGSFTVTEEFLVLTGTVELSGHLVGPGRVALVPAGCERRGTRADGAVALAWFSGAPAWSQTYDPAPGVHVWRPGDGIEAAGGELPCDHPAPCLLTGSLDAEPVARASTVVDLGRRRLLQLRAGERPPAGGAGPYWLRSWQS